LVNLRRGGQNRGYIRKGEDLARRYFEKKTGLYETRRDEQIERFKQEVFRSKYAFEETFRQIALKGRTRSATEVNRGS